MGRRIRALLLCLLLLLVGCAKPAPGDGSETSPPDRSIPVAGSDSPHPTPAPVATSQPRLILDLPLGDGPEQPGQLPARVGGISPRGPLALAADRSSVYLVDAAKSRVLHYDLDGRLVGTIPTPWLDDQVSDLAVSPFGLSVTLPNVQYTIGLDGRFLAISQRSPATDRATEMGKGPWPIGTDVVGDRYERAMSDPSGLVARRVSSDGRQLAFAPIGELGEIHDWNVTRDGGLYALSYLWGQGLIEGARVYEVLPPVHLSSGPGGMDPTPAPLVMGYPLPTRIRLTSTDWAPMEITAEADCWNLWQLLAAALPEEATWPGSDYPSFAIEATLPNGSPLLMEVRQDELQIGERRYRIPFYAGLKALIQHLRLSEESLKAALTEAASVRATLLDLPGVERTLTAEERERMRQSLTGVIPVSSAAGPHPLEAPFPQAGIRLDGKGWTATLRLQGDRHIRAESGGAALHSGELTRFVTTLLPVPELRPSDIGYLYLADKLEIGQGGDLTRWKNTVVRRLIAAQVIPGYQPTQTEPFTLTFWVDGEKLPVQVDADGFTYGGKRYPGTGLLDILYLQGVP